MNKFFYLALMGLATVFYSCDKASDGETPSNGSDEDFPKKAFVEYDLEYDDGALKSVVIEHVHNDEPSATSYNHLNPRVVYGREYDHLFKITVGYIHFDLDTTTIEHKHNECLLIDVLDENDEFDLGTILSDREIYYRRFIGSYSVNDYYLKKNQKVKLTITKVDPPFIWGEIGNMEMWPLDFDGVSTLDNSKAKISNLKFCLDTNNRYEDSHKVK